MSFARLLAALLFLTAACGALARIAPKTPPPEESAITLEEADQGRLATRYLWHEDRPDQKLALWLPSDLKTVRGLIFILDRADSVRLEHYQAMARELGFGLAAALIRWDNYHQTLPAGAAALGKALGHDYLDNVPWVLVGGSRNVGAWAQFFEEVKDPDRVLTLLSCGAPGAPHDSRRPVVFRGVPMATINGSVDPFVKDGVSWAKENNPKARAAGCPHLVGVEWDTGHDPRWNGRVFWPFIRAVVAHRYPADADPRAGKIRLRPFLQEDGFLVGPVDWENPADAPGPVPFAAYAGDPAAAVWVPDQATYEAWRDSQRKVRPQPYLVGGTRIDQPAAQRRARDLAKPEALVRVSPAARATLDALVANPPDAGASWRLAWSEDFSGATLYPRWDVYRDKTKVAGSLALADGALRVSPLAPNSQAIAMLPFAWPEMVALQARLRSDAEQPCDLSLILNGNPGGNAFPWREGLLFSFGGRFNTASLIRVLEQPDKDISSETGARITPSQWHVVRFEREDRRLRAFVNGKLTQERLLTDDELGQLRHRRLALYTFNSPMLVDDVEVHVKPQNSPAHLAARDLDTLASELLALRGEKWAEQSRSAETLLSRLSPALAPSLRRLAATRPDDAALAALLADLPPQAP